MPNASGFVDFNQQMDLTGDEEQRLLEEAMARAEQADAKAQSSLRATATDATNQNVGDITQSASYSDYLAAKRNASNAWAAVTGPDANPRSVRSAVASGRLGAQGRSDAAGSELERREGVFQGRVGEDFAEKNRNRAALEAYRGRESAAAKERQDRIDAAQEKYRQSAYANWMRTHERGDSPEDQQRYAQMLSGSVDEGWKLPQQTADQRANTGGVDRRGWAIETEAWKPKPGSVNYYGRPTTKKGTAY